MPKTVCSSAPTNVDTSHCGLLAFAPAQDSAYSSKTGQLWTDPFTQIGPQLSHIDCFNSRNAADTFEAHIPTRPYHTQTPPLRGETAPLELHPSPPRSYSARTSAA